MENMGFGWPVGFWSRYSLWCEICMILLFFIILDLDLDLFVFMCPQPVSICVLVSGVSRAGFRCFFLLPLCFRVWLQGCVFFLLI